MRDAAKARGCRIGNIRDGCLWFAQRVSSILRCSCCPLIKYARTTLPEGGGFDVVKRMGTQTLMLAKILWRRSEYFQVVPCGQRGGIR